MTNVRSLWASLAWRKHREVQAGGQSYEQCGKPFVEKLAYGKELPGEEVDKDNLYKQMNILRYHSNDLSTDLPTRVDNGVEGMKRLDKRDKALPTL